jgi:hypothetical protein
MQAGSFVAMQPVPIVLGHRYTIFTVASSALTTRTEIVVMSLIEKSQFKPDHPGSMRGRYRIGTYKQAGKRKSFYLDLDLSGTLVIPGWNLGIPCDHEKYQSFAMSATMNLAASPEVIREMVSRNINPNFSEHDRIVAYPEAMDMPNPKTGMLVYPDAPTNHAVIQQMKEAQA